MERSACFTGHREMSADGKTVSERLDRLLERLVTEEQITDYYAGGAVGFDTIAAKCVLRLREKYPQVKLHLVLPCSNEAQTRAWTAEQKIDFFSILKLADSVEYTGHKPFRGCMAKRNARLAELANEYCVCWWEPPRKSGTSQTIGLSAKKGLKIVNLNQGVQ